jgi:ADP-heptose:LPS heptosyltransferase
MNILVTRLQSIGDMLTFVPALRLLRKSLPGAKITLLTKHVGGIEVIKECPYYDDMIVIKNRSLREKIRLIFEFRKRKFDYFVISTLDYGRVPWALMGGAKKIVAFKEVYNCGALKKEKLPYFIHISPTYDPNITEVENNVQLIKSCLADAGINIVPDNSIFTLEYSWFKNASKNKINLFLKDNELCSKKIFVIVPVSAKQKSRNWNIANWSLLASWIQSRFGYTVIFNGGKDEFPIIEVIVKNCSGTNPLNVSGKFSIDESAYLFSIANGYVGLDSGPAFLADAVAVPSVILYGPGDFIRWHPHTTIAPRINIHHKLGCSPCNNKICPKSDSTCLCMDAISLDEVKNAVDAIKT